MLFPPPVGPTRAIVSPVDPQVEILQDGLSLLVLEGNIVEFDLPDRLFPRVHGIRAVPDLRNGVEEPLNPLGGCLRRLQLGEPLGQFLHGHVEERGVLDEGDEGAEAHRVPVPARERADRRAEGARGDIHAAPPRDKPTPTLPMVITIGR